MPLSLLKEISSLPDSELRGLLNNLQTAEFVFPTQLFPDLQFSSSTLSPMMSLTQVCEARGGGRFINASTVAIERILPAAFGELVGAWPIMRSGAGFRKRR